MATCLQTSKTVLHQASRCTPRFALLLQPILHTVRASRLPALQCRETRVRSLRCAHSFPSRVPYYHRTQSCLSLVQLYPPRRIVSVGRHQSRLSAVTKLVFVRVSRLSGASQCPGSSRPLATLRPHCRLRSPPLGQISTHQDHRYTSKLRSRLHAVVFELCGV